MGILALGLPALIAFSALLLFGAIVVLMFTLGLVKECAALVRRTAAAQARLRRDAGAVAEELRVATAKMEDIRSRRRPSRRARAGGGV